MPGSTKSGRTLENLIGPVLVSNGYTYTSQKVIGVSLSGKKHRVDALITLPSGLLVPLSLKWQEVSGTAEEKVPYEVIKLIHAVKQSAEQYPYAYLVLAGEGWSSIKSFYLQGGLKDYIIDYQIVRILTLDAFITRANRKTL
jgi:hypothetical protein